MPHKVTKLYTTLIVGYGVVGRNLSKELAPLYPDINDNHELKTYSGVPYSVMDCVGAYPPECYDVAFICVDTPSYDDNKLDISQVEAAISENEANIYVIKSTLPLDGIERLHSRFPHKDLVYSPEYYGATQHCNNVVFDFTILGGNEDTCYKVQQILQHCYDARHTFHITDPRTAALSKLMENSWLATVVSFCTQMFEICHDYGINYEELRELFILDPRVNPSHTFVYEDHPYWDSHCLNKDVNYLATWAEAQFLQGVVKFNDDQKAKYVEPTEE